MAEKEKDKYIEKMEENDTKFCDELDAAEADLQEVFDINPNDLYKEFMRTIGNMQRYNTIVIRKKMEKNKVRRYKTKLYAQLYEKHKNGGLMLKSQHEYDTWISKNTNYARCDSYLFTIDALIAFYEQAVKGLSQKVYALQSMLKSREYETGPTY